MRFELRSEDDFAAAEQMLRREQESEVLAVDSNPLPQVYSAAELYVTQNAELRPLVEGLLYDGLTMLIAQPKTGKSWLALQLSVAVSGGRPLDGIAVRETGRVLFVALEEPPARTANRLRKLAPPDAWLQNLSFIYELRPLMQGGAEDLSELIRQNAPRFVVIDTFTALVKVAQRQKDVFRGQYEEINRLRQVCVQSGICCLLIHHSRKGRSDGPVQAVAGTGGMAAGVDSLWHLHRMPRKAAVLEVVGREVEERSFALQFNRETPFGWRFVGDGEAVALSAEREEIIDLIRREGPLYPAEIASRLAKNPNTVRSLVQRLQKTGHIERNRHGQYELSDSNCNRDRSLT